LSDSVRETYVVTEFPASSRKSSSQLKNGLRNICARDTTKGGCGILALAGPVHKRWLEG